MAIENESAVEFGNEAHEEHTIIIGQGGTPQDVGADQFAALAVLTMEFRLAITHIGHHGDIKKEMLVYGNRIEDDS